MQMTNEKIDRYLANTGEHCPFCDSENLDWNTRDAEGDNVWQDVQCYDCNRSWRDYYKLYDIEVFDKNGDLIESSYLPIVWLVTVSNEVGVCFRAVAQSQYGVNKALSSWCADRWQDMSEPDGEGALEEQGCAEDMIERYFNFMSPEEDYSIYDLRLGW